MCTYLTVCTKASNFTLYEQVQQKWNKMLLKYKEHLKHKSSTGTSPKIFEYFEEMDMELGDRPDIKPVVVMGSDIRKSGSKIKI